MWIAIAFLAGLALADPYDGEFWGMGALLLLAVKFGMWVAV